MQALYFFKSWKPTTTSSPSTTTTLKEDPTKASIATIVEEGLEEEGDDSFFELELTSTATPHHLNSNQINIKNNNDPVEMCSYSFKFDDSFTNITKRKILPLEPILKSASKLNVLAFNKSRSTVEREGPVFTRDNSLRKHILEDPLMASSSPEEEEEEECSKLGKYLKLFRPFYVKFLKNKEKRVRVLFGKFSSSFGSPLHILSPLIVDSKGKWLGKGKQPQPPAASAAGVRRRDDSLESDGIQSAILHCKKSFNSCSKESSSLMTCFATESLHAKYESSDFPMTGHQKWRFLGVEEKP